MDGAYKMNRIKKVFEQEKVFIGFLTGGDPTIKKTKDYIKKMVEAGTDIIEIGIPFSDPIAEGPTIQDASIRALKNKVSVSDLLDMVGELRNADKKNKSVGIPLLFMTYLNPIYHFGYEKFFKKARAVSLDGIIIPDFPFEEQAEVKVLARKYNINLISFIAPTTSKNRIKEIVKNADGFIYLVSSMGVTGVRSNINLDISKIVSEIKKIKKIPVAIGFGISNRKQVKEMQEIADGAIIGSAIVKIIAKYRDKADEKIYEFIKKMTK
ncbi:MAG: tryptophan synthase subunit alpha [Clostridiales Family XIII bacterium]|jgi:tryptophan synthase alpha chain|nr:tryptophan synthase subunit alpha [Clostridiales Family XIII bacterium]